MAGCCQSMTSVDLRNRSIWLPVEFDPADSEKRDRSVEPGHFNAWAIVHIEHDAEHHNQRVDGRISSAQDGRHGRVNVSIRLHSTP